MGGNYAGAEPIGKVTISIRFDPLLWREFKKKCFENDRHYSDMVEQLVREYLFKTSNKSIPK